MHFTRLHLSGFKSFVDSSDFIIKPGLTGIVGPNGCGKSNLVEALRWVMGETSAKGMRGKEMDDVIFGGTTSRPARNLAEVMLHIDNSDRTAPAAFNDSDSIEVSRQIDRGQGSTYRINGREVRALDVRLLFADQATGAHSTALVSQGEINALISAKPSARRVLLEEAAGITKFKQQKKEALRKLDYTEQNLLRLEDTIREVKRQIGSLQRQAGKAKRYQKIMDELRELETKFARHEFDKIDLELQEIRKESERIRDNLENHSVA